MLCYRDMTFCTYYKNCAKAEECDRALTPEIQKDADKWWESFKIDGSPPICMFAEKPECYENKI